MSRISGDVHLVGSVPLDEASKVFKTCSTALAGHLSTLPDGEVGYRARWITCQALFVFDKNPAIETTHRPVGDGKSAWIPRDYEDNWTFKIKPGAQPEFGDLKYAGWAAESYGLFRELRTRGEIPNNVRFQVCLPTPFGGCALYFTDAKERQRVYDAYRPAMVREALKVCEAIPHDDLAIQWDVCVEVIDAEQIEQGKSQGMLPGDVWQRWTAQVGQIAPVIPSAVALGYHFCYGDLGRKHVIQPKDLEVSVRMSNIAIASSRRPVDWVHMPVPANRRDDAYVAPLRDLRARDTRVFIGLLHQTDGVEGSIKRAVVAKKYLNDFGVATECGLGRYESDRLPELLRLHRTVAEQLHPQEQR
jgi:hypothetical protein